MTYTGGKLSNFFDVPVLRAAERTSERMAQKAGKLMVQRTKRRTPRKTGRSHASIVQKPVRKGNIAGAAVYTTGAVSASENVRRLEFGTHPHVEEPRHREAMHWHERGKDVFARRVNHPGTKGLHMFAIAAAETEATFEADMADLLEQWRIETEGSVKRER